MKTKLTLVAGILASVVAGIPMRRAEAQQNIPASLPVYEVTKAGPSDSDVRALADKFNIPVKHIMNEGGVVSFVDTGKYMAIPTVPIADSTTAGMLADQTKNKARKRPIEVVAFDPTVLTNLPVMGGTTALEITTGGLTAVKLSPQFGMPQAGNSVLTIYSRPDGERWIAKSTNLDTTVSYTFMETNGFPLVGPGAQVQLTFDAAGDVTRLHYAASQLKQSSTSVAIISGTEAMQRISRLAPTGATVALALVYWAPSAQTWLGRPKEENPKIILPWYAYTTTEALNTGTTPGPTITSRVRMMPATDDPRFVPVVSLTATKKGFDVIAHVSVKGGAKPYTFLWGGSNPGVSRDRGGTIIYRPMTRLTDALVSANGLSLQSIETVSVTVIDSNGISVIAQSGVPVVLSPANGRPKRNASSPSYGCESPNDPGGWTPARIAWQKAMGTSGGGGGVQSYCWEGASAWAGDFIEPATPGTLVSKPWIYGDADYSNWGVNTADVVLNNNDGNPDATVEMQPGAPVADYATSYLNAPVYLPTVTINLNGFGVAASYNNPFPASWGPQGPNDTLHWLLMDDCDTLDPTDSGGLNVAQRWGPAFNGLHVMTGFASPGTGDGAFEYGVAANFLGLKGASPETIVQSWFNSAQSNGAGTPAAMGPLLYSSGQLIGSDSVDHYWNKGSVGPTIVPADYPASQIEWWYVYGTNPNTVLP